MLIFFTKTSAQKQITNVLHKTVFLSASQYQTQLKAIAHSVYRESKAFIRAHHHLNQLPNVILSDCKEKLEFSSH